MDKMRMTITGSEARALLTAAHDDGCPPECSGSCVVAALRLDAHGRDLAIAVIALEAERDRCLDGANRLLAAQREDAARLVAERDAALREAVSRHDDAHRARQERDEARAEAERRAQLLAEVSADQAALAMGVWSAVHDDEDGTPSLDTPRDRAEVIAAVESLRAERDHARAMVEHMRRLCERRAEERHTQEARAIRAERERHEAAAARDEAVLAREADAAQHRQDLLAIANALGCTDTDPASLVAAAAARARTGGAP